MKMSEEATNNMLNIRRFKHGTEIVKMREKKLSYQQIGEELGLTKQCVWDTARRAKLSSEKQQEILNTVKYPAIKEWIAQRNITVKEFCNLFGYDSKPNGGACSRFITGQTNGNLDMIRRILEITGLTFEEAFKEGM